MLVYESFQKTLRLGFPDIQFCVYVDDVALVAPNRERLAAVMRRIDELSSMVGFHPNRDKTQVYKWSPHVQKETIAFGRDVIHIQPPIFQSLGHLVANPEWHGKARDDILTLVTSDLQRYQTLPLEVFERARLINTILMPKWLYRGMFVFNDLLLATIDLKARDFVTFAENIEQTHNATHVHAPVHW